MEALIRRLQEFHVVEPLAVEAIEVAFTELTLPKYELLVEQGKTCRHLYFLEKGALRGFYTLDGKEVTHWFGFENDFVTSFHSFITQQSAVENIQLIEGSVLRAISKEQLTALLNRFPSVERLLRIAYENYYIRLEERYVNAHFRSAAERYEDLLARQPHIIERVPLGQIAAYLGITQETLSRVRSKY
ncbi:MAG: Crp/Fnr family transcriptional regulator [Bacteroidetes bacterium]|nr:Crp/Fnr family transcriptional regulator [Bacteroidota bacterium]